MVEAAATAFASIFVLGTGFAVGGYLYHRFYKWLVIHKMEGAFMPGDPVLDLAAIGKQIPNSITSPPPIRETDEHWILRDEQTKIDNIVNGSSRGHYHLLIGEKGTGKSSMLLDAMQKIDGEGCSMFEAHADLEIFRIRLGKALDFEFHEDYIGSYFSERGPRESTALLDIERAFNKLEKVALKRRKTVGKPLILIINAVHLLRDNDDGRDLLELLQQRAEQWAASNLVTMVFNSDEYWVYERLKQLATRMEVTSITDLPKNQAISALSKYRLKYFAEQPDKTILEEVYDRVGGRLTFLNRVAKSKDMLDTCNAIIETEKRWFLNQCWILGMEMDDDVMDQQKYAVCLLILLTPLPPPPTFFSFSFLLTHLLLVRSHGSRPSPRRRREITRQPLRPHRRLAPDPADPAAQGAPDYDARGLHQGLRPHQSFHHHQRGVRARRQRADAARIPGHLRGGGLRRSPRADAAAH